MSLQLSLNRVQRTVEVGIFIHWDLRANFIDQLFGFRKADLYYTSNDINNMSDESKPIIITTKMLIQLFLFIVYGYLICFTIFFAELCIFFMKNF